MLERLECPRFDTSPWVAGPPLAERRIALVSSAGLYLRGERAVVGRDPRYRRIPHDAPDADVLTSHVSVNFDRTGFQRDAACYLPRARLDELAAAGVIGSVGTRHYAFMGATAPEQMTPHAHRAAAEMREDGVDSVLLLPV
jgi:D-proline reductase (dithiol) PrdB